MDDRQHTDGSIVEELEKGRAKHSEGAVMKDWSDNPGGYRGCTGTYLGMRMGTGLW